MPLSEFEIIAEAIKIRRKTSQMTQKRLAQLIGVSPRTIYSLENGDDSVSVKTLLAAVAAIGFRLQLSKVPDDLVRPTINRTKSHKGHKAHKGRPDKDVWRQH